MNVYASCSSYVLGQLFGPAQACARITEAVQDPKKPPPCFAVEALRELATLANVTLRIEGGASHLAKARSRHFAEALASGCDVWVAIDDDVRATRETLAWLLEAVSDLETARVCIAPCLLRDGERVNVEWSPVYYVRRLSGGGSTRSALGGGFGLVAMNRAAMTLAAAAVPTWRDPHDGALKPAAFLEILEANGTWVGEDVSFFRRLPKEVRVDALTSGKTFHAGHELALGALNR